ncbi:MAG: hypothetical protein ABIW82_09805 [Dokdonella sp.]
MNPYDGQRFTRSALAAVASVVVIGVAMLLVTAGRAYADQTDPAMSAAVFEDVPAPSSAPVAPSTTIATVTLQPPPTPPTEAEIDAANGVARDPAKDIEGSIRFDDLPHQIGARIRVLTRGQRLHNGVVRSADSKQVTISVNQRGGSATYILPREQIQRIDPH